MSLSTNVRKTYTRNTIDREVEREVQVIDIKEDFYFKYVALYYV